LVWRQEEGRGRRIAALTTTKELTVNRHMHCPECGRFLEADGLYCERCDKTFFIFEGPGRWKQVA